jgi:hypothetical protein
MFVRPNHESAVLAEFVAGRQDRLTGKAFRILRVELGMDATELAAALDTTPQEIHRCEELGDVPVPEKLDMPLRRLFWNRR